MNLHGAEALAGGQAHDLSWYWNTRIRALSIRQPWAWLVVNGYKDVENRGWWTQFRGAFLVHAGMKLQERDWDIAASILSRMHPGVELPRPEQLKAQCGGIVGVATMVDCVRSSSSPWFFGQYGFVLQGQKPIRFHRMRGALGFFRPKFEEVSDE